MDVREAVRRGVSFLRSFSSMKALQTLGWKKSYLTTS